MPRTSFLQKGGERWFPPPPSLSFTFPYCNGSIPWEWQNWLSHLFAQVFFFVCFSSLGDKSLCGIICFFQAWTREGGFLWSSPLSPLFLLNNSWRSMEKDLLVVVYSPCIWIFQALYLHTSPHLAFNNSLKIVAELFSPVICWPQLSPMLF